MKLLSLSVGDHGHHAHEEGAVALRRSQCSHSASPARRKMCPRSTFLRRLRRFVQCVGSEWQNGVPHPPRRPDSPPSPRGVASAPAREFDGARLRPTNAPRPFAQFPQLRSSLFRPRSHPPSAAPSQRASLLVLCAAAFASVSANGCPCLSLEQLRALPNWNPSYHEADAAFQLSASAATGTFFFPNSYGVDVCSAHDIDGANGFSDAGVCIPVPGPPHALPLARSRAAGRRCAAAARAAPRRRRRRRRRRPRRRRPLPRLRWSFREPYGPGLWPVFDTCANECVGNSS